MFERVPAHLRRFVVEHDYAAYDGIDQAVWRFVLLQLFDSLQHTAHPAYVRGMDHAGISTQRIPRIEEMDAKLSEFGWGAVCVDGFIPPAAFQEFQALGILPIAADIRTHHHLPYTPAPDIIHEAAGHAPMLADPDYAAFLRRIGKVGSHAFSLPHDQVVYDAIYALSVAKENSGDDPRPVRDAEQQLDEALAATDGLSEAGRLARLYWWTVEYGLIGRPDDFLIYGAGLLSSLGESHSCQSPDVLKRPLDASCVDVAYDITRAQPQLFVANEFAQLQHVLEDVSSGFAMYTGGRKGLELAVASGQVATLRLDTGVELTATVRRVVDLGNDCLWVETQDDAWLGSSAPADLRGKLPGPQGFLVGPLEDGRSPAELSPAELERGLAGGALRYACGAQLRAPGAKVMSNEDGVAVLVRASRGEFVRGDERLGGAAGGALHAWLGGRVTAVHRGALDGEYWPATEPSGVRSPTPKPRQGRQAELLSLYADAKGAADSGDDARVVKTYDRVLGQLDAHHAHEWLLRWNLLENLPRDHPLAGKLVQELRQLELHYERKHPIAMGLRYLGHDMPPAAAS